MKVAGLAATVVALVAGAGLLPASADVNVSLADKNKDVDLDTETGDSDKGGLGGRLSEKQTRGLPPRPPGSGGSGGQAGGSLTLYEYRATGLCTGGENCGRQQAHDQACSQTEGRAPASMIQRRVVSADGSASEWEDVGITCFTDAVPGSASNPQLTIAMIREAVFKTPFAKPHVSMQPVGNKTLVTLPVYFKINWPSDGYQPDEVHSITLLGYSLRIKPTFHENTFNYGDGNSSGATKSFGGVHPTGDITHEYKKKGSYNVSASTTYGGQVSLEGGPFMDVDGSVDISGPAQELQVVTAKNRLVE